MALLQIMSVAFVVTCVWNALQRALFWFFTHLSTDWCSQTRLGWLLLLNISWVVSLACCSVTFNIDYLLLFVFMLVVAVVSLLWCFPCACFSFFPSRWSNAFLVSFLSVSLLLCLSVPLLLLSLFPTSLFLVFHLSIPSPVSLESNNLKVVLSKLNADYAVITINTIQKI